MLNHLPNAKSMPMSSLQQRFNFNGVTPQQTTKTSKSYSLRVFSRLVVFVQQSRKFYLNSFKTVTIYESFNMMIQFLKKKKLTLQLQRIISQILPIPSFNASSVKMFRVVAYCGEGNCAYLLILNKSWKQEKFVQVLYLVRDKLSFSSIERK